MSELTPRDIAVLEERRQAECTVLAAETSEPIAGGFQVDGASGSENTFVVDGQEVTNFRTGALNINNNLPFQLVQEVQVKSSGFEAEFGGAGFQT